MFFTDGFAGLPLLELDADDGALLGRNRGFRLQGRPHATGSNVGKLHITEKVRVYM